ncbi:hypothetical protein MHBO_001000 [Bonamia ostreae]|uniref:Uncharacterized protein n=1 Tax=Bonamia ostreae TaxID=126728 RepID=A0ABV2AHI4_9EUKA
MNAFYGDLRLHGKDILDYIERGYDVFTRMRSLLSIWQSRMFILFDWQPPTRCGSQWCRANIHGAICFRFNPVVR